jgi:hypothetical protein
MFETGTEFALIVTDILHVIVVLAAYKNLIFINMAIKKTSQRKKVSTKFVMVLVKYQNNRSNCMVTDSN